MAEYEADCNELIAAGWGEYERRDIPRDWRTRRPPQGQSPTQTTVYSCLCGHCATCKSRKRQRAKAQINKALRKLNRMARDLEAPPPRKTLRRGAVQKKALDTGHERA